MVMRVLCLCFFGILFFSVSFVAKAAESLCAEVKIEILQEVSLERQGFEAMMRITNSLDTFSLENVSVTVNFKDVDGNPVIATSNTSASNASFFIRVDATREITGLSSGVDGAIQGGTIAPKAVGEMRWLIIPTAKAAGQTKDGRLFYVGAQLKYSYGGKEEIVDVASDSIIVKPQPALTLDYFLTQEIVGDNGFTPEIEAAEPYTLGVRINNSGFGYAKSVKIESAQPTITENKQGLAVGFKIIGSYLSDQPSSPSLLLNFGDIEPHGVVNGRWIMETNLAGTFSSFTASFTHADELGGTLTSLLQGANANFLIHDIVVNLAGRDSVRDFLAVNSQGDLIVYESENTGSNEVTCDNCKKVADVQATIAPAGGNSQITILPQVGFSHVHGVDPYFGARVLSKVIRADGSSVDPQNYWLSKKRSSDKIHFDYFVNIFDYNSSSTYTLYWGDNFVDLPQAPVIQFLPDRVTYEGGNVGFIVRATDPNQTIPNLAIQQLPAGASFILSAPNQGVFNWSPQLGQAGIYPLTFTASDGSLQSQRSLHIRVNPGNDTDGDGMDDNWERQHFGDLSHDGTGDSDGDGRSDLQEFNDNTDPDFAEGLPAAPQVASPTFAADTLQGSSLPLEPSLVLTNGKHPANVHGPVAIVVEVYKDDGLTQLMARVTVPEGQNITAVKVGVNDILNGAQFEDNHRYYWRAKSQQQAAGNGASSNWIKSQFFINTANDLPTVPQILNPADGSDYNGQGIVVVNSVDKDNDALWYSFELYDEADLSHSFVSTLKIQPGRNGWTPMPSNALSGLIAGRHYLWRANVDDGHGVIVSTPFYSFTYNTTNSAPTSPQPNTPVYAQEVTSPDVALNVINATDQEGSSLTYFFELDQENTFDTPNKVSSPAVTTGGESTSWMAHSLADNTRYYWRARAFDGSAYGPWLYSQFTVDLSNQAPSTPTILNPDLNTVVSTLRPLLEVNPATDPEGRPVVYRFELYSNENLTGLIAQQTSSNPYLLLGQDLIEHVNYFWRVRAEDSHNLVSEWSPIARFSPVLPLVNEAPIFVFTLPNHSVTAAQKVKLQWVDSDADDGAKIALYYRPIGGTNDDKRLIASGIEEDLDGLSDQFTWNLVGVAPGSYKVFAEIDDGHNTVVVNNCCSIEVTAREEMPLFTTPLAFSIPLTGANYAVGTPVNIAVDAASTTYGVTKVNFYDNGVLISTDTSRPYTATIPAPAPGEHVLSAVAIDRNGSTVIDKVLFTVTGNSTSMNSEYFSYREGVDGPNLSSLAQAYAFINNRSADATFTATRFEYGITNTISNSLGFGDNLQRFLAVDAESLSNDPNDSSDAIIHLRGYVDLNAGTHSFRVTSDDGYQISLDGVLIAQADRNQAANSTTHDTFMLEEGGIHNIDIVYWDQGDDAIFKIEVSNDGGTTFETLTALPINQVVEFIVVEDTSREFLTSQLLANDNDPTNNNFAIISVQDAIHGTVSLTGSTIRFTPIPNYSGPASFSYTARDSQGGTHTTIIDLIVSSVNDAPVAEDDSIVTEVNSPVTLTSTTLLNNDVDSEGSLLLISSVQSATHGSVSLLDGEVTFIPANDYEGMASFTYTVTDSQGKASTATVNIAVSSASIPSVIVEKILVALAHGSVPASINFPIITALADIDGSESVSISVSGLPIGASFNYGSYDAMTNSWFFGLSDLSGLVLTLPVNYSTEYEYVELTVNVTTSEIMGGKSATTSTTLNLYSDYTTTDISAVASDNTEGTGDNDFIVGSAGNHTILADYGNDIVLGAAGQDVISGGNGSDVLYGGGGNDTINGEGSTDRIYGGSGNDLLTGGADNSPDVFVWREGDQGPPGLPAIDIITDFSTLRIENNPEYGGDIIDIHELLSGDVVGAESTAGNLINYLHFEVVDGNTVIHISNTGGFAGDSHIINSSYSVGVETQRIVLTGVDLIALYNVTNDDTIITRLLRENVLITH